jgi:NADPH-dependent methylglyoxal reductase
MSSPSEQTLLVTGANSYVASHIIKLALEKGYNVRGTVRSERSTASVREKFASHTDKLSFAIVSDITKPELFEAAFASPTKPITGVINVASPFVLKVEDNKRDLLDPAIGGGIAILEAIKRYGTNVRRLINTSSFACMLDMNTGARPGYTYTDADWNPMTYEEASTAPGPAAYCASKALAEKAIWDWVAKEQPSFGVVVMNPPWVFGPHIGGIKDTAHLNESSHALYSVIDAKEIPPVDFAGFVDVRTLAEAHIAAFEKKEGVDGERFLVGSHFDYQSVVDTVRAEIPELKDRLPVGTPGKVPDSYVVDGSKAERVLGIKYIPLSQSMKDSYAQFVEAASA